MGLLLLAVITMGVLYLQSHKHFRQQWYLGAAVYVVALLLGGFTYSVHQEISYPTHYTRQIKNRNKRQALLISVTERLKSGAAYTKYLGVVQEVGGKPATGKVLVVQKKGTDSVFADYSGKDLIVYGKINKITEALNPYEFDYAGYLSHQQVYGQVFLAEGAYKEVGDNRYYFQRMAQDVRKRILTGLAAKGLSGDEWAVTAALFLGQRQDISEELYSGYVNAGVIHILAISGLHIGILTMLLNFLFVPLRNYTWGRGASALFILCILWSFAFITGLAPSVIRSVTMFSVITIALHLRRPQNTLHTIMVSAFVLLLFNPDLLFMVGFQLSYLAVIGIVLLQPPLQKVWPVKNRILSYFWNLVTVMVAAQVAVLPISLYYFHQFPLLFFVGNLCIIPFLALVLGYGFLTLVLTYFEAVPEIMVAGLSYIIKAINYLVSSVASVEGALLQKVYFDELLLGLAYLVIALLAWALMNKSIRVLKVALCFAILFQGYLFYTKYRLESYEKFWVFHQYNSQVIGVHEGYRLRVFSYDSLSKLHYLLDNYTTQTQTVAQQQAPQNIYVFKNKRILVLDTDYLYNLPNTPIDYVVLTHSPWLNPDRVLRTLHLKMLIVDGDNNYYIINMWKKACKEYDIPFYNTQEQGAFLVD